MQQRRERERDPEALLALAVQLSTLKNIQAQRNITDRRLENALGVHPGAMKRFYAGEEGYTYLVDRVDLMIGKLSRKDRKMAYAVSAQKKLAELRKTGEWIAAEEFLALVHASRGGDKHEHLEYEQLMQELPFYGEGE